MDPNPDSERRVGLLDQLASRQEDYRGIIRAIRAGDDHSFSDGLVASAMAEQGEDQTIAVATVLFELSHDPDREPAENDILWASEFMDHLDTLGFQVRRKRDGTRIVNT
jgi:hypothetical protein